MKTLHIAVLTTSLLAVAGCQTLGFEKKSVDYKSAATRAPSLEVPFHPATARASKAIPTMPRAVRRLCTQQLLACCRR